MLYAHPSEIYVPPFCVPPLGLYVGGGGGGEVTLAVAGRQKVRRIVSRLEESGHTLPLTYTLCATCPLDQGFFLAVEDRTSLDKRYVPHVL